MSEEKMKPGFKWMHPSEVMKLHNLKRKKKALQARMQTTKKEVVPATTSGNFENVLTSAKRKNPFITSSDTKRTKPEVNTEESADQTLFKLLHLNAEKQAKPAENYVSFDNILNKLDNKKSEPVEVVKVAGEKWIPIDWTLKTKVRFLSSKPFAWNQKLKISEEASGLTSFTRCLDTRTTTSSLDTSSNSKFHQCCLYWQQPSLPWMNLFPRTTMKASAGGSSVGSNSTIRESLHIAWTESLKSLFQLIRTKQCPYFYACANSFTVLFRAAGIGGFNEMHALVTPTTRGFRQSLRQEEIEFTMPLKKKIEVDAGYDSLDSKKEEDEDETTDEDWLESMGINKEDIKKINYTQAKITQKAECELDNSEQSLVLIQGPEVQAFYSYLVNCKSAVAPTGTYAGIPPTLLAPVAFNGATLNALKVRESKVHLDNDYYYSLDLSGPILPHLIHNLCLIHPEENSMTATFSNFESTLALGKITVGEQDGDGNVVFKQENLSDCGLASSVLKSFVSDSANRVSNFECIKYTAETSTYAWD